MVRTRKEKKTAEGIKLSHPDRTAAPSEDTLLKLAQDRNLFEEAERKKRKIAKDRGSDDDSDDGDELLSSTADRVLEAVLWSTSLSMLHFTLDVLVQHQYAISIIWPQIIIRSVQASIVFFLLIYVLHPHVSAPSFVPGLPVRFQYPLRQILFLTTSITSGCYLIHISNKYSYLAVMKQSPPLGCLWVWSVIELDLPYAVLSLACIGGFFYQGGYTIKQPY
ncbi:hypothetical protein F4815DRAFT_476411 [Daldinia loculata]|uniref:uncharacterized protein n=1 Tax=Daldinia loculata TaxID=103429 RepID=UPI0020C4C04C|nr:uncharacterized protein F4817DRAFT_348495 [Daldinia loculata]KAI1643855.1 hypothetical protein F4817DRAFT_348495 [Daldinia loculata]KAI2778728.1 hypothetical protein F4815DRAFT_476411 [Daldinia loculata]